MPKCRLRYLMNVRGAGTAAAADELRPGGEPLRSHGAELCGIGKAGPAAVFCVPTFARVGVDEDGLAGSGVQLGDELWNPGWGNAVDADGESLRERGNESGRIGDGLAVGDVLGIAAGEADPDGKFGPGGEGFGDGVRFIERRDGFEGQEIGGLRSVGMGEDFDALAMEADEIGVGAVVIAVVFGAVVECCAVRAERGGDEDAAGGEFGDGGAGDGDGFEKCGVGVLGRKAALGVAHARDLVAAGGNALSSGGDESAMDGGDFIGLVFKDVGGPQRTVDAGAEEFEFGGEAAVDDAHTVEDRGGFPDSVSHFRFELRARQVYGAVSPSGGSSRGSGEASTIKSGLSRISA